MHAESKSHEHKMQNIDVVNDWRGQILRQEWKVLKCAFEKFADISEVLQPLPSAKMAWHSNFLSLYFRFILLAFTLLVLLVLLCVLRSTGLWLHFLKLLFFCSTLSLSAFIL